MMRKFLIPLLLFISFCAPQRKVELLPPSTEVEEKIASADALFSRGCYVALKQAFEVYQGLYVRPDLRGKVAAKLVKTSLLLAVREKELGIMNRTYMDTALKVIQENPPLRGFLPYAEVAGLIWIQGKGVMRDIDERFVWRGTYEKLTQMEAELKEKAREDEFFAYMYATLKCYFSSPFGKKEDLTWLGQAFPDSLLVKFKLATCPQEDEALLKALLEAEPEFYEVCYFLGNISLGRGNLLEAETHLQKAHLGIPESSQVTVLLASIHLALEELEPSLEFYEKTLAIVPEYRDALLGKGICLSYMSRHEEAIAALEKIISLGHWLIGESYYWLAWNQYEMKIYEQAAASIEQAKGRLPTSSEVFTLSGKIASEKDELVKAEKDFKEALQYNQSNSEALFGLGSIYARQEEWLNSGSFFEKAASAFEAEERALQEKVRQAEQSSLSGERKEKLIRKKRLQIEKVALSKATAFYNAAAGYHNGREMKRALEMARRASEHPSLKQKAEELILMLKKPRFIDFAFLFL